MKSRVIIALSLALVMLLTVAAPALAKPTTGTLEKYGGVLGTGTYALAATRNNNLKITIVLKGVAQVQYQVWIIDKNGSEIDFADKFTPNSRGSVRYTVTTNETFSNTDSPFDIRVGQVGVGAKFYADNVPVTFD